MQNSGHAEEIKISYFQVDTRHRLKLAALFAALQDTAVSHSDRIGFTVGYLAEQKKGWAVVNWHLLVERMPLHGEKIRIETWSNQCRRMQAERSYLVTDEDGKEIIRAESRWIYMDLEKRRPTSVPQEMIEGYHSDRASAIAGEKYEMPKVGKEEAPFSEGSLTVTRRDMDANGHANNVKYLEWAMDHVPDEIYEALSLCEVRVVYRKECYRGDTVLLSNYIRQEHDKREVLTVIRDQQGHIISEVATIWA